MWIVGPGNGDFLGLFQMPTEASSPGAGMGPGQCPSLVLRASPRPTQGRCERFQTLKSPKD